jgi:hypothetical protein
LKIRVRSRYTAVLALLAASIVGAVGTTVIPTMASADSPTSLQVQTNSQIASLGFEQIQVQIQRGTSDSSYDVTVQVAGPSGAGGPFCQTVTVATNGNGNGWAAVDFPGTFLASACSPAGTGGPSTILPGNYTVTVSSVPAIASGTLSATFTVQAPPNTVTGTGTISSQATSTISFIQAPASTASSPLYVACSGTTATPTVTTAPYYVSQVGAIELTGVIATDAPGQVHWNVLRNPCNPSATSTFTSIVTGFFTFDNVTVTLPDGRTVTGGLQMTEETSSNSLTTTSGTTTTTVGTGQSRITTIVGTGGLRGVTGLGLAQGQAVTVGSTITSSVNVYWVQLTFPYYDH